MPIRFACPSCQKNLKVGDQYAGQKSKCPACAFPIVVPTPFDTSDQAESFTPALSNRVAQPPAAPPSPAGHHSQFAFGAPSTGPLGLNGDNAGEPSYDAPARGAAPGKWRGVQAGLRMVRTGTICQLVGLGIFLFLLLMVFFAGMQVLAEFSTRPQVQYRPFEKVGGPTRFGEEPSSQSTDTGWLVLGGVLIAGLAIVACLIVGEILRLIGLVRCAGAPAESGAAGWAIAAVLAELVPYGAMVLGVGLSFVHEALGNLMSLVQLLGAVCALVFFLLFLRQVGVALGSEQLPARVLNYVIWLVAGFFMYLGVVCLGVFSLFAIGIGAAAMDSPLDIAAVGTAGMIVLVCIGLLNLTIFLTIMAKYLALLQFACNEIRRRAGRLQST